MKNRASFQPISGSLISHEKSNPILKGSDLPFKLHAVGALSRVKARLMNPDGFKAQFGRNRFNGVHSRLERNIEPFASGAVLIEKAMNFRLDVLSKNASPRFGVQHAETLRMTGLKSRKAFVWAFGNADFQRSATGADDVNGLSALATKLAISLRISMPSHLVFSYRQRNGNYTGTGHEHQSNAAVFCGSIIQEAVR